MKKIFSTLVLLATIVTTLECNIKNEKNSKKAEINANSHEVAFGCGCGKRRQNK